MRMIGALVRAFFVILLISTPSLLLPPSSHDVTQMVALVAIFGAALTIFEYGSRYPGLVEFRDAPPFNRIRFLSLLCIVVLSSILVRGQTLPNATTWVVETIGRIVALAMDFPYSPVRLIVLMLPETTDPAKIELVRMTAGLSYLISLTSLAVFMILMRLRHWPVQAGAFNVWVNLPTFDPTAVGDVVERLQRDARVNIALGFLLPFLTPALVKATSTVFGAVTFENPHTLIWTVAAWAFLPSSLFMRGIAMGRVANMIERKRKRRTAEKVKDTIRADFAGN